MRVAYVCTDPGIPVLGAKGASLHVRAVLRDLVRRGHEVHLVCARTGEPDPGGPPLIDGVHLHHLPAVGRGEVAERERRAQATDAAVAEVLDDLALTAPLDLVYERYALWGRTAMTWARRHGVTGVLEVNAPLVEEQAHHRGLVDRAGAEAVAVDAVSAASTVVCVSDDVRDWARSLLVGPPDRRDHVHTVANGVDTTAVGPADHPPVPARGTRFTIGFVGTLKPWHGTDVLLDAFARLARTDPTYRLLLVGAGPEQERLAAQAADLGVADAVEMTGAVDATRVPDLLRRMDAACAPYPPLEACYFSPLKVYEYLAAGLPMVASRIGVLPDLLEHGRLGALVPPGDAAALAAALAECRADHPARVAQRRRARETALGHDWSHVVGRILHLAGLRSDPSREHEQEVARVLA